MAERLPPKTRYVTVILAGLTLLALALSVPGSLRMPSTEEGSIYFHMPSLRICPSGLRVRADSVFFFSP